MTYTIEILTTDEHTENISNQLTLLGVDTTTWQDAANQPLYEPRPDEILLWKEIRITAYFSNEALMSLLTSFLNQLASQTIIKQFQINRLAEQDWVRVSLDQFKPIYIGKRLCICPSWDANSIMNDRVNVLIDPGLAFGTGTHATTALCLAWLEKHISGDELVVDYGCGSGLLAITALRLGANSALAIDYDPQALDATLMNAKLNQIDQTRLLIAKPEACFDFQADILIANILANTIINLLPHFFKLVKPNGIFVFSGILVEQSNQIEKYLQDSCVLLEKQVQDEWVCLAFKRNI